MRSMDGHRSLIKKYNCKNENCTNSVLHKDEYCYICSFNRAVDFNE